MSSWKFTPIPVGLAAYCFTYPSSQPSVQLGLAWFFVAVAVTLALNSLVTYDVKIEVSRELARELKMRGIQP